MALPGLSCGIDSLRWIESDSDLVQFRSVAQSCPTHWDPMNRSTPGLPVHHQLPKFTQTHVHWVGDTIQPSHPLSSPSPPAFNLSQHQGLFKWVSSSHQVAKLLEFQLQHQSFQWTPRTDLLQDGLVGSPCSPRDSRVFSNTAVQKHEFFGAQLSLESNSHIHTWLLEKDSDYSVRFVISEDLASGPETRLDHSGLLCGRSFITVKRDRESFWHRHQKGGQRVSPL